MSLIFQPMPLLKRRLPFDHPEWIFELKYDGTASVRSLTSSPGAASPSRATVFASFSALADAIASPLPHSNHAVLDGEIVCLDKRGHPQFNDLLFHRGEPCFFAFDLLQEERSDYRLDGLLDRKRALKRLLSQLPASARLKYVDHVEGSGVALFEFVCQLDLERIVAKHRLSPYVTEREQSTWYKIRNRSYSQMVGREELFERDRRSEPVPGRHSCALACAALEA
jgi:bifunctional non-homologous end joining protein LigD